MSSCSLRFMHPYQLIRRLVAGYNLQYFRSLSLSFESPHSFYGLSNNSLDPTKHSHICLLFKHVFLFLCYGPTFAPCSTAGFDYCLVYLNVLPALPHGHLTQWFRQHDHYSLLWFWYFMCARRTCVFSQPLGI